MKEARVMAVGARRREAGFYRGSTVTGLRRYRLVCWARSVGSHRFRLHTAGRGHASPLAARGHCQLRALSAAYRVGPKLNVRPSLSRGGHEARIMYLSVLLVGSPRGPRQSPRSRTANSSSFLWRPTWPACFGIPPP
ncbi:hypothetical protein GW17_00017489 [Ensete ventricosum]|nr:hypothetical protein GW17_00017489 [Ensete ventricosum]